jgi:hypothetical protein
MNLEQATAAATQIIKEAMAADEFLLPLCVNESQLFDAARVIGTFAIDLLEGDRVLESPDAERAGRKLRVLLGDATGIALLGVPRADKDGAQRWLSIAGMLNGLLARVKAA